MKIKNKDVKNKDCIDCVECEHFGRCDKAQLDDWFHKLFDSFFEDLKKLKKKI